MEGPTPEGRGLLHGVARPMTVWQNNVRLHRGHATLLICPHPLDGQCIPGEAGRATKGQGQPRTNMCSVSLPTAPPCPLGKATVFLQGPPSFSSFSKLRSSPGHHSNAAGQPKPPCTEPGLLSPAQPAQEGRRWGPGPTARLRNGLDLGPGLLGQH